MDWTRFTITLLAVLLASGASFFIGMRVGIRYAVGRMATILTALWMEADDNDKRIIERMVLSLQEREETE